MKYYPMFFTLLLFAAGLQAEEAAQVPFGNKVGDFVVNYNRTTPFIATSGTIDAGSLGEIKALGFKSILDIRTPTEGVDAEQRAAAEEGLIYLNLPVDRSAPSGETLTQFSQWVENDANFPTLLHCGSANRVGLLWGMYRIQKGISLEEALSEAKTIGMKPSREQQLRDFARESK